MSIYTAPATSATIADGSIVDADVNATAAIAGTKVSPNFGSQTVQTTGVFSHALGTAAAPTVAFTGDPNTGIYSPGADQLALSTNGTGRLFVDSLGRVGIGTTSPSEALTVAGNASFTLSGNERFSIKSSASPLVEYKLAAGNYFLTLESVGSSQGAILFNTGTSAAAERARIDSSGRLLVGTSTNTGGALFQVNDNRIRVATAKTPASATDTGSAGEICWDANYIYVCTATNTWKRSAIATW